MLPVICRSPDCPDPRFPLLVFSDDVLEYRQKRFVLAGAVTLFAPVVVVIRCRCGRVFVVWRRSCGESNYRLLLYMLKNKKERRSAL